MLICRPAESKVNNRELNYCRCQYAETTKEKSNIEKWNTADVIMQRQSKEGQMCKTEMLQTPICKDKETKVRYAELKY